MKVEIELDDEKAEKLTKMLESIYPSMDRVEVIDLLKTAFTINFDNILDLIYQTILSVKSGAVSLDKIQQKYAEAAAIIGLDIEDIELEKKKP